MIVLNGICPINHKKNVLDVVLHQIPKMKHSGKINRLSKKVILSQIIS